MPFFLSHPFLDFAINSFTYTKSKIFSIIYNTAKVNKNAKIWTYKSIYDIIYYIINILR